MPIALTILLLGLLALGIAGAAVVRLKNLHLWLPTYVCQEISRKRQRPVRRPDAPIHVLLCIADHFEPHWGGASDETARERVDTWAREYPKLFGGFRDSDGRPPRHTFFYPIDQYDERNVERIAALCREGLGELEVHLHHDHDTAENLERTLNDWKRILADRHGVLGRWPDGEVAFGFVHGNWALDNSRPDGRWCGVRNELAVLKRAGCFADFTLPSAPDSTQTRKINSIYYATGRDGCCKAHDRGIDVGTGAAPVDSLMLIQGPLGVFWPRDGWKPRIENGCIQSSQPPSKERLDRWIRTNVGIRSRPDWVFVKLHTHGATESNMRVLLDLPMAGFHAALAERAASDPLFVYHYVTAREMYNLAKASEAGFGGSVSDALDWVVGPPSPIRIPAVLGPNRGC